MRAGRLFLFALTIVLMLGTVVACEDATATPAPTPLPKDPWVQARLEAFAQLYGITPEGRQILASLDVRHMVNQPAWFGSSGFDGFTGIGQARPISVTHELGHSYWGAFPVTGRPDLSWNIPPGEYIAPAIEQYRQDLRSFMFQPPDRYEPLRERFRNFPNLFRTNLPNFPDLFHAGEADMVRMVAGDLNLMPPIFRKYFDRYLSPGQFQNWNDILRWYLGLRGEERRIADSYLGLVHIPREAFRGLLDYPPSSVPTEVQDIIRVEEQQRLIDFAEQFIFIVSGRDSLQDAAGVDRGFPFWRGLLREMFHLHKRYPELLSGIDEGRAQDIGQAFDVLVQAEGLQKEEQVAFLIEKIAEDTFLNNFLPILENRVLVTLLGTDTSSLPTEAVQKGTGAFVEELRRFIGDVDRILGIGEANPEDGARALEEYLSSLKDQDADKLGQDVETIFELFADTDNETTQSIMAQVKDSTIRELLGINAAGTRLLLEPVRLLDALDIMVVIPAEEMTLGIEELLKNSSGNFAVDRPFTEEVYRRISIRGRAAPEETLGIIKESDLPMPGFLFGYPEDAISILSSDLEVTLDLVTGSGPIQVTPVRLIYHLIYVDPVFAARVVEGLSEREEDELVSEALIYFAYDQDRLQSNAELKISLEGDALFLKALLQGKGSAWLSQHMASAIARYKAQVDESTVDPDFLDAYRRTLQAALNLIEESDIREGLEETIADAFSAAGLDYFS